jgi:hypothetical protein
VSEAERKTKGLNFPVSSEREYLTSTSSENGLVVDLLNYCCDLTDAERLRAEPTDHDEAFHGQSGARRFFRSKKAR